MYYWIAFFVNMEHSMLFSSKARHQQKGLALLFRAFENKSLLFRALVCEKQRFLRILFLLEKAGEELPPARSEGEVQKELQVMANQIKERMPGWIFVATPSIWWAISKEMTLEVVTEMLFFVTSMWCRIWVCKQKLELYYEAWRTSCSTPFHWKFFFVNLWY